jgi:hypothetical protein
VHVPLKDDLIFVIEPQVRRFCGPLFFTTSLRVASGNITNNASFGLINTGKRKLLVTCHHVWEEFKKLRSRDAELMFGLCLDMPKPIAIRPEDFIIDEDRRCDLVTFDMESLLPICANGGLAFYNLQANRPPTVKVGDVLYFIGFPGKGRLVDDKSVGFVRQPIGVQASQVGKFTFFSDATNLNKQAEDFGGISGCPCFLLLSGHRIRLIGFATGFAEMTNWLQFTYATFIRPDGTIDCM